MLKPALYPRQQQSGFLLIEALVAILIFSLGVIALIGFQSIAIGQSMNGKYRTEAGYLANSLIGQMMVDKANFTGYNGTVGSATGRTSWNAQVANALPNGTATVTVVPNTAADDVPQTVTVTVNWQNPDDASTHNHTTISRVIFQKTP